MEDEPEQKEDQQTVQPQVRQSVRWEPPRRKIGGWALVSSLVGVLLFVVYLDMAGLGSAVTVGTIGAAAGAVAVFIGGLEVSRWAFDSQARERIREQHRQDLADMQVRQVRMIDRLTEAVNTLTSTETAQHERSRVAREHLAAVHKEVAEIRVQLAELTGRHWADQQHTRRRGRRGRQLRGNQGEQDAGSEPLPDNVRQLRVRRASDALRRLTEKLTGEPDV